MDVALSDPVVLPSTEHILAVSLRGPSGWPKDRSRIVSFNLDSREVNDSFTVSASGSDDSLQIYSLDIANDGKTFFVIGDGAATGPIVAAFSLETHQILFSMPLVATHGRCRVSPDGSELWVTDPGHYALFGARVRPGHILVLNATSGAVLDTIPTRGLDPDTSLMWWVDDIQFVPGQSKAYVNTLKWNIKETPILVIDTETRMVEKLLFGDFSRSASSIAVVPEY